MLVLEPGRVLAGWVEGEIRWRVGGTRDTSERWRTSGNRLSPSHRIPPPGGNLCLVLSDLGAEDEGIFCRLMLVGWLLRLAGQVDLGAGWRWCRLQVGQVLRVIRSGQEEAERPHGAGNRSLHSKIGSDDGFAESHCRLGAE